MFNFQLCFFKSRNQLQLENIFLRKQLEILNRNTSKLNIKNRDRLFFLFIRRFLNNWINNLIIIKPETIIKWHRKRFSEYLSRLSKNNSGRPKIPKVQIELIRRIANENPMWGVPRIHGELLKLGYKMSQATVWRYTSKDRNNKSGQRWKTFLKNHASEIVSLDFICVPTINFKLLHVLVIISHIRRKIIHVNITENPSSEWCAQQLKNTLYDSDIPKYLIRNRDCRFGDLFKICVSNLGIREVVTAYRSPWQNGYVERVIGTIRREFLDHVIVMNENHLRRLLTEYIHYYNHQRTHIGLNKDSPESSEINAVGRIEKIPVANGLHNYYFRKAA